MIGTRSSGVFFEKTIRRDISLIMISRSTAVQSLISVAKSYADVVESSTLPLLFHHLPDRAPSTDDIDSRDQYRRILKALTKLWVLPAFFETLFIRIITKLELLGAASYPAENDVDHDMSGNGGIDTRECNIAYAFELLKCLTQVVDAKLDARHTDVSKYFDKIIPRLHGILVAAAVPRFSLVEPLFRDRRLLSIIADLTESLMWELTTE